MSERIKLKHKLEKVIAKAKETNDSDKLFKLKKISKKISKKLTDLADEPDEKQTDDDWWNSLKIDEKGWYQAKTFDDIRKLYIDFFDGKADAVPTYRGKLNPDTVKQLQLIREINSLGFLTVDSQNGEKKGKYVQRAYVVGYIKKTIAKDFVNTLGIIDGIVCTVNRIYSGSDELVLEFFREGGYPVSYYPTTGLVETREPFLPYSGALVSMCNSMISLTMDEYDELFKELCYVSCVDTISGREDYLAKSIIDSLNKVLSSPIISK